MTKQKEERNEASNHERKKGRKEENKQIIIRK